MRLAGWVQRDESHGPPMDPNAPGMLLLHTMEGWLDSSMATLSRNGNWPHLCYAPDGRRKYQGVDTDFSSKALGDRAGGVETRTWGPVQVELEGFAAETQDWPDEWLRNIAVDVVVPCVRAGLCDLTMPPLGFLGTDSGSISLESAPQRLTTDQWYSFHGICGHQHAPENGDRWDPGKLNVPRIIEHALAELGVPILFPPEDTMQVHAQVVDTKNVTHLFAINAERNLCVKSIAPGAPVAAFSGNDTWVNLGGNCTSVPAATLARDAAGNGQVVVTVRGVGDKMFARRYFDDGGGWEGSFADLGGHVINP